MAARATRARAAFGLAVFAAILASLAVAIAALWRRKRRSRASGETVPSSRPSSANRSLGGAVDIDLDTHVDLPGYVMMPDHVVGGNPGPKKIPLGRFDNPHEAKRACDGTVDIYACQYIVHVKHGEDEGAWIAYALVDVPLERVTHHIVSDFGASDIYVRVA